MTTVAEIFETMEYGPAPERDAEARPGSRRIASAVRTLHRRRLDAARGSRSTSSTRPPPRRSRACRRGRRPTSTPPSPRREQALPAWKALVGHGRARHLYALAREVQKHSRLLAVLESMDNGKSIRETRDLDIPLVARHFYHHAGWAQLFESEFAGLHGGRRRRADHSVELPAAHAGVEGRAGARRGKHGRAQAGGVHAAHRARSSPSSRARRGFPRACSTS